MGDDADDPPADRNTLSGVTLIAHLKTILQYGLTILQHGLPLLVGQFHEA